VPQLLRPASSVVKALLRFYYYGAISKALRRRYEGATKTLLRHYEGAIKTISSSRP
jgi:hypothetical protein